MLGLPPAQVALAEEIVNLEKPTAVFLLNGGMVALPNFLIEVHILKLTCARFTKPASHLLNANQENDFSGFRI